MIKRLHHFLYEWKGWGIWACSTPKKTLPIPMSIWREGVHKMKPGSVQWCPGIEQETENDAQEVALEHEEEYFYRASDHTLTQGAQRMCGFSLIGDIPYLSGCSPMPDALGWLYLSRQVGPDDPPQSCESWPILWFCDIRNHYFFFPLLSQSEINMREIIVYFLITLSHSEVSWVFLKNSWL